MRTQHVWLMMCMEHVCYHGDHRERSFGMKFGNTGLVTTMIPGFLSDCPRCGGFMATQDLRDFRFDSMWYLAQRCVNCGCIWDPVIGRHQRMSKVGGRRRLKKSRPPRHFPQPANLHAVFVTPTAGQAHVSLAST